MMRNLIIVLLIVLFAAPTWAATRYISQTATNGYQIGNNANDGLSKSTPWLTVDYANTTATTGDVIVINDGVYMIATFLNLTKNLTWTPETTTADASAVVIRSSVPNATRLINFNAALSANVTQVWGAITLDAQNASLYVASVAADAYTFNLTFNGTKFVNPQQSFINASSTLLALTINNGIGSGSTITRNGITAQSLVSPSSVSINGFAVSQFGNNTAGTGVIALRATNSGVTASVRNVTGSLTLDGSLTGAGIHQGVQIYNIANALIDNCNLSINGNPGTRTAIVYWIGPDPTTAVDSSGGIIQRCTGSNGTNGGIMALIGQDDSTVAAPSHNMANNGQISGCTLSGSSTAEGALHGAMLGNSTGGRVFTNKIDRVNIGALAKGQTGGLLYSNLITRATGQYLRAKAATNTIFANNTLVGSAGYSNYGILSDHDTVTSIYSTGVQFDNNLIYTTSTPAFFATVSSGSTSTFANNLYFSTAALPANPWSYQGTNYANLAAWQAAREATALSFDPQFISATDYHLSAASPARGAAPNVAGLHDQSTVVVDADGAVNHVTPTNLGAYDGRAGITISADYSPTGYALRGTAASPASITVRGIGLMVNLSSLTNDEPIQVKVGGSNTLRSFTPRGTQQVIKAVPGGAKSGFGFQ